MRTFHSVLQQSVYATVEGKSLVWSHVLGGSYAYVHMLGDVTLILVTTSFYLTYVILWSIV